MALPLVSFTVNDGASTPVAQTFTNVNRDGMKTTFRNFAASLVRGQHELNHEIRYAKQQSAANRAIISLVYPVEGVVDGQTTVVRISSFRLEANFNASSPESERSTAYGLFLNILGNADIKASVPKLQTAG